MGNGEADEETLKKMENGKADEETLKKMENGGPDEETLIQQNLCSCLSQYTPKTFIYEFSVLDTFASTEGG